MKGQFYHSVVLKTAMLCVAALVMGCATSKESAERDTLTAQVGQYSPPPAGAQRVRVGVPPFKVTAANGGGEDMNDLAADQMTTLLDQTGRFDVIERTQLKKLLDEQNLEGVVKAGELAQAGQVRGVDYLLLGRVTNLRVKKENKSTDFGLAQFGGVVNTGGLDVKNNDVAITTECGVDIRLVDPASGRIAMSNFSEFKRTDSAHAMGLQILGANAQSNANVDLSEDDKGKILRLALDDSLRKGLPKIDGFLASAPARRADAAIPAAQAPVAAPVVAPVPVSTPDQGGQTTAPRQEAPGSTPASARKFCPNCGKPLNGADKFCPNCGWKLE